MAKHTPDSTPCSSGLRGISEGVSAAAKRSAPITRPRPEKVRHSSTGSPASHPSGPRRGGGGAAGGGEALAARRRRELDCGAMISPGNSTSFRCLAGAAAETSRRGRACDNRPQP